MNILNFYRPRTSQTSLIVFFIIALTACGDKKDSASPAIVVRGSGPRAMQANGIPGNLQGRIFDDRGDQKSFQEAVNGLISTDIPAEYIGFVSASPGMMQNQFNQVNQGNSAALNNTGVFFGGDVRFNEGPLNRAGNMNGGFNNYNNQYPQNNYSGAGGGNYTVVSNSAITIVIRDANPQYPSAAPLPPITIRGAQGGIYGNQVQLRFTDQYTTIDLIGTIDYSSGNFMGSLSYDNSQLYDGSRPGAAGGFARAQIPICQLFKCQ